MKTTSLLPVLSLLLLIAFTSCKEEKKAATEAPETEIQTEESESELKAEAQYQCPMDCEHGKTYDAPGTCPVCKMDLKPVAKETAMTCSMHKDGKCSCDKETCACTDCPEHSKG